MSSAAVSSDATATLAARSLSRCTGVRAALRDVNSGELEAIIGPNGAGKTLRRLTLRRFA